MNRGVAVFRHHALGDQDRVFEVVTVPRHESDQHVLTDGDFAQVSGCAVGNHITFGQLVTTLHNGALVNVGVLVRTLVFDEVVNVNAHFARLGFVVVDTNHDAGGIDIVDHTTAIGGDHGARVNCGNPLDTCSDQWLLGAQHRHGLA